MNMKSRETSVLECMCMRPFSTQYIRVDIVEKRNAGDFNKRTATHIEKCILYKVFSKLNCFCVHS